MKADTSLAHRALGRLVKFQLSLAVLLFLPAGTVLYWEGWLFWSVFGISNLAITLYFLRHDSALIRRRLAVGPRAERRLKQKILQAIASALVCVLVVVPGIDHCFHWSTLPIAVVLAAHPVFALYMLMVFLVFKENSFTSAMVVVEP